MEKSIPELMPTITSSPISDLGDSIQSGTESIGKSVTENVSSITQNVSSLGKSVGKSVGDQFSSISDTIENDIITPLKDPKSIAIDIINPNTKWTPFFIFKVLLLVSIIAFLAFNIFLFVVKGRNGFTEFYRRMFPSFVSEKRNLRHQRKNQKNKTQI